jgi:hypothetical protein
MQEIGPGTPSGQRRRPGRGGTCTGASQTTQGHMEPRTHEMPAGVLRVVGWGRGGETPKSLVRACYAIRGLDYLLATYLY